MSARCGRQRQHPSPEGIPGHPARWSSGTDPRFSAGRHGFDPRTRHSGSCYSGLMPYKDPAQQQRYQREWIAQRRAEWFQGKSCVDCNATTDLQIDHVDPQVKVSHRIWSWSRSRREAELVKCVVRCSSCHLKKTLSARENGPRLVTLEDVEQIRIEYSSGNITQKALGAKYGISQRYVSHIVRRDQWA